jgi:hypothetical protein
MKGMHDVREERGEEESLEKRLRLVKRLRG